MHLRPDELIDLAEGTRAESSAAHLAECAVCRLQVAELKAMMSAAADVDVPEPSPLFWDHFSARVHAAVADETPRPSRRKLPGKRRRRIARSRRYLESRSAISP